MSLDEHVAALRAAGDGDDAALAFATRLRLRRSLDDHKPMRLPALVAALAVLLLGTVSWALATGQVQKLWRDTPDVDLPSLPSAPYSQTEPAPKPPASDDSVQRVAIAVPHAKPADDAEADAHMVVSPPIVTTNGEWGTGASPPPKKPKPKPVAKDTSKPKPAPQPKPRPATEAPRRNDSIAEAPMSVERSSPLDHAPVESLYRAAHEIHFHGNDPAAALAAWDRYLAVEPTGRFAVEARYNRALCLIRLGHLDDARTALAPFANGDVDPAGYRQDEAKTLIERIGKTR